MTGNNKQPLIRIHPILVIFILISFVTGTFISLATILSIVIIHEFGHYIAAKWFGWHVYGVKLWVFGGVMDTDEQGTRPLHEEIIVTLAGPAQHIFIYIMLLLLRTMSEGAFIPVIETAFFYNIIILVFNMLPLWPLDGGKLLLLIVSEFIPYRRAYNQVILLSLFLNIVLALLLLIGVPFTLSAFLLFMFLIMENRTDWKQRYFVFMRFLLQRYQNRYHSKKTYTLEVPGYYSLMDVFNYFRRDRFHNIYISLPGNRQKYLNEKDCLYYFFHEHQYQLTLTGLMNYVI